MMALTAVWFSTLSRAKTSSEPEVDGDRLQRRTTRLGSMVEYRNSGMRSKLTRLTCSVRPWKYWPKVDGSEVHPAKASSTEGQQRRRD